MTLAAMILLALSGFFFGVRGLSPPILSILLAHIFLSFSAAPVSSAVSAPARKRPKRTARHPMPTMAPRCAAKRSQLPSGMPGDGRRKASFRSSLSVRRFRSMRSITRKTMRELADDTSRGSLGPAAMSRVRVPVRRVSSPASAKGTEGGTPRVRPLKDKASRLRRNRLLTRATPLPSLALEEQRLDLRPRRERIEGTPPAEQAAQLTIVV